MQALRPDCVAHPSTPQVFQPCALAATYVYVLGCQHFHRGDDIRSRPRVLLALAARFRQGLGQNGTRREHRRRV